MQTVYAPPFLPLVAEPSRAFNPVAVWVRTDRGPVLRDIIGGNHVTLSGGDGSYWAEDCPYGLGTGLNGGGYSARTMTGFDNGMSVTVPHARAAGTSGQYPGIFGFAGGQIAFGYTPVGLCLIRADGVAINIAALPFSDEWCTVTCNLDGFTIGSKVEYWITNPTRKCELFYTGSLAANLTGLNGATIRIGSGWNGNLTLRATAYWISLYNRPLSGQEIRALHADPALVGRSSMPETFMLDGLIDRSFRLSGEGIGPGGIATGALGYGWPISGSGAGAGAIAAGDLGYSWGLAGEASGAIPGASGELEFLWELNGAGAGAGGIASGALDWVIPPPPPPRKRTINSRVLIHRAAIHPIVETRDAAGSPRLSWPAPRPGQESVRCRVVEYDGATINSYLKQGKETIGIVYFPPFVRIESTDQLVFEGRRYAISAPPRDVHDCGHHIEVEIVRRVG